MITAVSISLYALSVFFSSGLGATSQKFKIGEDWRSEAALGIALTAIPFALAVILQVFA